VLLSSHAVQRRPLGSDWTKVLAGTASTVPVMTSFRDDPFGSLNE